MRAQSNDASAAAPAFQPPRTPRGNPNFTGIYQWPKPLPGDEIGHSNATIFDRRKFAPLKPGGEAFLEPRTGDPRHDEPRDFCMPAGFPGGVLSGNAMQLFETNDYLVMVHEFQRMTRIIPLDGRPHQAGIEPTYYGDSVGHWEGDTLVIESTNFKRWVLDDYFYTNPKEYRMHSDAVKFTERIKYKTRKRFPTRSRWTIRRFLPLPGRRSLKWRQSPSGRRRGFTNTSARKTTAVPAATVKLSSGRKVRQKHRLGH